MLVCKSRLLRYAFNLVTYHKHPSFEIAYQMCKFVSSNHLLKGFKISFSFQKWSDCINNSSKLVLYKQFKPNFGCEYYLEVVTESFLYGNLELLWQHSGLGH